MNEKNYKYLVRLPLHLRERLMESAAYYRRSVNSDIVARLQHSFSGLPDGAAREAIAPLLHDQIQHLLFGELTREELQLVRQYRALSSDKRMALLNLLS
jgi:hypothetical protein